MATATQSRFSRGGGDAIEAEEALSASRGNFTSFRKTNYLPTIGKGNKIVLRYLLDSDDWYYIESHPGAPTKPQPLSWPKDRKYPASMPAVCRYDKSFKADPEKGLDAVYTDCYICDAKLINKFGKECKPVVRVYTLAILREEVLGTQEMATAGQITAEMVGRVVGYRDGTREVEVPKKDDKGEAIKGPDGKTVMETIVEPAIIVVNQAVNNYFQGLQSLHGIFSAQGESILDRDFIVQQNNDGKDVEFQHIPLNPTASLKPGTESWKRFAKAIEEQGDSVDIPTILMDRSSDDFFATFFDPTKEAPKREGSSSDAKGTSEASSAPEAQQNAAPTNEPANADALAAMRARVRGAGATAPAETPTPQATTQEEPAAAAQEEPTPVAAPAGGPIDFA